MGETARRVVEVPPGKGTFLTVPALHEDTRKISADGCRAWSRSKRDRPRPMRAPNTNMTEDRETR